MSSCKTTDIVPIDAISNPISKGRIFEQVNKTTDTPFEFKKITIILDDNTYIPKISAINSLRRECLDDLINQAISRFERNNEIVSFDDYKKPLNPNLKKKKVFYSLLLNKIHPEFDYNNLINVDRLYIPIRYFLSKRFIPILDILKTKGALYISLPTILKDNYRNITFNRLEEIIETYNIKGIVISNIANADTLIETEKNLEIVGNFTLNVFNSSSIVELQKLGVNAITLSPELDKETLKNLASISPIPTELMVYGRIPLMNMGYCLLGHANRCYPTCESPCKQNKYYLKDRLGYKFKLHQDNVQTITTLYNSKILSIPFDDINIDIARISVFEENIEEINNIVNTVKTGNIFSGEDYTYGNFNRFV